MADAERPESILELVELAGPERQRARRRLFRALLIWGASCLVVYGWVAGALSPGEFGDSVFSVAKFAMALAASLPIVLGSFALARGRTWGILVVVAGGVGACVAAGVSFSQDSPCLSWWSACPLAFGSLLLALSRLRAVRATEHEGAQEGQPKADTERRESSVEPAPPTGDPIADAFSVRWIMGSFCLVVLGWVVGAVRSGELGYSVFSIADAAMSMAASLPIVLGSFALARGRALGALVVVAGGAGVCLATGVGISRDFPLLSRSCSYPLAVSALLLVPLVPHVLRRNMHSSSVLALISVAVGCSLGVGIDHGFEIPIIADARNEAAREHHQAQHEAGIRYLVAFERQRGEADAREDIARGRPLKIITAGMPGTYVEAEARILKEQFGVEVWVGAACADAIVYSMAYDRIVRGELERRHGEAAVDEAYRRIHEEAGLDGP